VKAKRNFPDDGAEKKGEKRGTRHGPGASDKELHKNVPLKWNGASLETRINDGNDPIGQLGNRG